LRRNVSPQVSFPRFLHGDMFLRNVRNSLSATRRHNPEDSILFVVTAVRTPIHNLPFIMWYVDQLLGKGPYTAIDERCFLCDPCRDVLSRAVREELS
jgi:hypothetical protein